MDHGTIVKLLVVLFHDHGSSTAVCAKATSQLDFYKNNREARRGCVEVPPGTIDCFDRHTIIQLDNLFPVPWNVITSGSVVGRLPEGTHEAVVSAVQASVRISEERRRGLLGKLDGQQP